MLFNSTEFLIFLPCVLLVATVLPMPWRNRALLVASYYFYGSWDWRFLALLCGTTLLDFWVGNHIHSSQVQRTRQRWLVLSLVANLGTLSVFKYYGFFVDSAMLFLHSLGMQASPPIFSILLPVGISFYVFQSMSYTIDIYRGDLAPPRSLWDFALYVAYFPQLVAGPIERATNLLPQIISPAPVTPGRINTAITLMILGFTKKVLIADQLAPEVDRIFSDPIHFNSGELLRGALFFVFQVYGDFSGYSDIARGVSELFGIRLMINFNQPYLARSVTEFWRRWHISLSSWTRDYLFTPIMMASRHWGQIALVLCLVINMVAVGVWHGARLTYIVFGLIHAACIVFAALTIRRRRRMMRVYPLLRRVHPVVGPLSIFPIVVFTFIIFRAPNLTIAYRYIAGIAQLNDLAAVGVWPFVVAAIVLALDVPQYLWDRHAVFWRMPWWIRSPVYVSLCGAVLLRLLYAGHDQAFIYFQF